MAPNNDNPKQEDLQFDKADFSEKEKNPSTLCAVCQAPLGSSYYKINQALTCGPCKEKIEQNLKKGNPVTRMGKALLFGFPAAVVGALLYFGILALTGYEFGLIAILIGWGVGVAVRKGSNGRGGWSYQVVAILLTYVSICSTYVPYILQDMGAKYDAQQIQKVADDHTLNASSSLADKEDSDISVTEIMRNGSFPQKAVMFILLLFLAVTIPFFSGFQNIMGLIIIGIGLYEAWKMNKRMPLSIEGPFERKT